MTNRPADFAGWRLFVATVALIAFSLQSYLTQTHIHVLPPVSPALSKTAIGDDSRPVKTRAALQRNAPEKAPPDEDPMKCPLCQAVGYAGHFVAPSATAWILLPNVAISILPMAIAILSPRETISHIWQGRGPPHS